MATTKIVLGLGLLLAIIIALWIAFRNFKLGDLLGVEGLQEGFDEFAEQTQQRFSEFSQSINQGFSEFGDAVGEGLGGFGDAINNLFENNQSQLAGQTVTQPDGSQITIPDETIVNDDGTVSSPTAPQIKFSPSVEDKVSHTIKKTKSIADKIIPKIESLPQEQRVGLDQKLRNISKELGTFRDETGFAERGFSPAEVEARVTNIFLNQRKNLKRKSTPFGGFDSLLEQEKALRDAVEESRKKFPQFFDDDPNNNFVKKKLMEATA